MTTGLVVLVLYLWLSGIMPFKMATELGIEKDTKVQGTMSVGLAALWPLLLLISQAIAAGKVVMSIFGWRPKVHEGSGCVFCDIGFVPIRHGSTAVHPSARGGHPVPCTKGA